ncbi:MAG: flagellar biosynthesis protein FlhF [Archangium sp.]|nr:flagellar biosynthesis protein FlhF [Archangium sp.]MDP3155043.1 flagellar biosynthesis protein FlhF [Archangium sp.]MDP3574471.1 flagellar biosynthesis protein FlhF [Archangium sp.]
MSNFRTFRAPDTRSALAMVKAALGADAIILATKEVDNGLFRAKEIEVTAGLPEVPSMPRVSAAKAYAAPVLLPAPKAEAPAPAPAPRRAESSDELQGLRASMEEMRSELRRMGSQVRMERELQLPPPAAELLSLLINRGVEDALAEACVRQALEQSSNLSRSTLLSAVRNALSQRVIAGTAPWISEGGRRRIVALVGPTGVGKTTSVAKIAARALMGSKQKVAMITVDTYRIGASEQLTRYGEIMNVPTFVARDRVELTRAIERCGNAELILVDSAGRSMNEAVARQAEMLRSVEGISLCLTVSACTGPREMAAAAERYRSLAPEQLLFTKVDEASGPGSLLSASVRIGRPIVAVSDGQRVPEDIHALSGADLVELVLGERRAAQTAGAR